MAGEIKVQASVQVDARTDGTSSFKMPRLGGAQQQITQTTPGSGGPGKIAATNAANGVDIVVTGLTALGIMFIKNIDPTATITWGPVVAATLHPAGKLKPGEEFVVRLIPGTTYAVKSSVASSPVFVIITDD